MQGKISGLNSFLTWAFIAGLCLTSASHAAVITFQTAPPGPGFNGPVTEDGYVYSRDSGYLWADDWGNPGRMIQGDNDWGSGVLKIVSAVSGEIFQFLGLDYAAWRQNSINDDTFYIADIVVEGYRNNGLIGTDTFSVLETDVFSPSYGNWTTGAASGLSSKAIDKLLVYLDAGEAVRADGDRRFFLEAVDNVELEVAADVPEPTALALMGLGLAGIGFARKKKQA